ncbi:polyketide synthase family protein [Serratia rubidaea]|uniref:polyketide synthase family protein n=1 Tax=Serratia rubidaea TaxID=61652 RepID=UPI0017831B67|nr:beta-ketoacyl synthase N-terminal-like domain-containing protein [Serratia rubidaea]MBD8452787.1 polyketide synthase [Serratia rubidaea]
MSHDFTASGAASPAYCFSAMAGEFPGAASVEDLWTLLTQGESAPLRSLLPHWQVDADAVLAERPGTRNRVYLDQAFTLDEPAGAASRQVGIGLRVLQRLLQEPGLMPERLARGRTGLILATSWSDESYFLTENGLAPGEQVRQMADRLQLGGPAFTVDTACSSFPYALEMAQGVINSGQADSVVVMAINTVLPLALYLGFSQLTAFSGDACLRAFGAEANGIVPAECACAFLLEPLGQAQAAGRDPLGLLTAVGLSSDGAEGSVFSPGQQAQLTAYRRAWQGLDPASVDYLETHGTATPLGDATELASLGQFFTADNPRQTPLTIGSIKAAVGHTLAAAGGPSLAKALLMLRHQQIPSQPGYTPDPRVTSGLLRLATADASGPANLRRLAVSSFGFGGANAHMIIDRVDAEHAVRRQAARPAGYITLNLSVLDADAALGGAFSLAEFQQKLQQPAVCRPFPAGRLAANAAQPLAEGHYLATDCVIDTHGYAMGPKALDHVDPFKLLVTALTGRIVARHPTLANSADTAMMMCCNLGGESFANAYARSEFFRSQQGEAPDVTVADVATMLPSMLSGYAAKIFDLRGCHQTLAGEAGLLWQTLLTLPHWFERGLQQVLLGAGRYISSHSELRHCQQAQPRQGEAAAIMLLKPWRQGDDALVVLRGAVLATHADDLSAACRMAGMEPQQISQTAVCELDAAGQTQTQPLHQHCGWLAEASGIEHLLQQIVTLDKYGVIEVRRQGKPWLWLFSERMRAWSAPQEQGRQRLPYTLRFAHPTAAAVEPLPAAAPVPAPTAESLSGLALLNKQVTDTLLAGLHARRTIMQTLLNTRRRGVSRHHVISDALQSADGWQATLRVNEQHPYFFDHPLDHVPGILLIAGGLQLVELAGIVNAGQFINDMHVRFLRYVDKTAPVSLSVNGQQGGEWTIVIRQRAHIACRIAFTLKTAACLPPMGAIRAVAPCRRADLLHKHRPENVLVGELFKEQEHYSVLTTALPDGHFFTYGDEKNLSMVYFLEIARQCYMQIAHDVMRVPLGVPMNLVTLHFSLNNAIPRQRTLCVAAEHAQLPAGGYGRTNLINLSLRMGTQRLGEARIVAQALEKHDVADPAST